MKGIIYILLAIVVTTFGVLFGAIWLHSHEAHRNTTYAERFTMDAFDRIEKGMPRVAILEMLGAPLTIQSNAHYPAYAVADPVARQRYANRGKIVVESLMYSRPKVQTVDYNVVEVSIGPDDVAVGKRSYVTD